jgi:hypothetical protein
MEITFSTETVWQIDFEFEARRFLSATALLLGEGDVVLFGAYEPTPELVSALTRLGATSHEHLPEFYTSFIYNRADHPRGCAFEYKIAAPVFTDILSIDPAILKQTDIPSFFDHFIAYRPTLPKTPLISFHDAACGGTLYLADSYAPDLVVEFSKLLGGACTHVRNPILKA